MSGMARASCVPGGPPVWEGMVSVSATLSRARCGSAVALSRGTATAKRGCDAKSANSRVLLDIPIAFARAELDITRPRGAGGMFFGVREADSAEPSPEGSGSADVLLCATGDRSVIVRGVATAQQIPLKSRVESGDSFTLRLDRAARAFYYIVRGVVSPVAFTELSPEGPLEFVLFLWGGAPASAVSVDDFRVDAASAAAAAAGGAAGARAATPQRAADEVCCGAAAAAAVRCVWHSARRRRRRVTAGTRRSRSERASARVHIVVCVR